MSKKARKSKIEENSKERVFILSGEIMKGDYRYDAIRTLVLKNGENVNFDFMKSKFIEIVERDGYKYKWLWGWSECD